MYVLKYYLTIPVITFPLSAPGYDSNQCQFSINYGSDWP